MINYMNKVSCLVDAYTASTYLRKRGCYEPNKTDNQQNAIKK